MRPLVPALLLLAACQGGSEPIEGTPDAPSVTIDAPPITIDAPQPPIDGCDVTGNGCGCQPFCGSRQCGDDGCGGSCGQCDADEECTNSGQCKYSGGDTTPPAAWVCNPTYWDAGDGCDCNCGALDPDCGQPGQQLMGCSGLASPTCTAQGTCTGGGACNSVPPGPYLTLYYKNTAAPVMNGGSVLAGRWVASDHSEYGNATGSVTLGADGSAIEITGTTWKRTIRRAGGYPNVDENFTASIAGNTLTLARTCPTEITQTLTFDATASTLKLMRTEGSTKIITTYTKQW